MKNIVLTKRDFSPQNANGTFDLPFSERALCRGVIAAGDKVCPGRRTTAAQNDVNSRTSALRSALIMSTQALAPTPEYLSSGSSNKRIKSFYIGCALCAHAAYTHLNIPWLYDVEKILISKSGPKISPKINGNSKRPDYIGRNTTGKWYTFESKGEGRRPGDKKLDKWKKQAEAIKKVNGKTVTAQIVSAAYLNTASTWELLWMDPPVDGDIPDLQFDEGLFFQLYYQELFHFLLGGSAVGAQVTDTGLLAHLPSAGLSVGLHREIIEAIAITASKTAFSWEHNRDELLVFLNLVSNGHLVNLPLLTAASIARITDFAKKQFKNEAVSDPTANTVSIFADGIMIKLDSDSGKTGRGAKIARTHHGDESPDLEELLSGYTPRKKQMECRSEHTW